MFVFGAPGRVSVSAAAAATVSDGSVATAPAVDASRRMSRRVMDAIPAHSTTCGNVLHSKSLLIDYRHSRLRNTEPKKPSQSTQVCNNTAVRFAGIPTN